MQLRKLNEDWLRTCTFPGNQFQVTNGHWLQIQPLLQTLVEGVSIATYDELRPIITTENALGPGAHAAITMNPYPDLPAPYSQKAEVIEVIDPMGNHALIKIWLIQLGVKPVTPMMDKLLRTQLLPFKSKCTLNWLTPKLGTMF